MGNCFHIITGVDMDVYLTELNISKEMPPNLELDC